MNAFRDYEGLGHRHPRPGRQISPSPQEHRFSQRCLAGYLPPNARARPVHRHHRRRQEHHHRLLIERINDNRACRIITLEDPIEYMFPQKNCMISQREVGRDVRPFAAGLRSMMREDPDVIFVGEMRDSETVSLTLTAAETGHLVFSTLHTRDVTGSITRILDFFPTGRQDEVRNQLSLGLAYVISQKLIPRKNGQGRIVAMEILNNNYAVANLIRKGKVEQIYSIMQTKTKNQQNEKMITFERHLAQLVKQGHVDLLEAQKWANDLNSFEDAMKIRFRY